MREILFRGKRVDNGEWIKGDLIENQGDHYIYEASDVTTFACGCTTEVSVCCNQVVSSTVGQFTGLTDKNGKKIFEGDILQCDNIKGIVKYSDKQAAFTFKWKRFNFHGGDSFKECVLADFGKFYDLKLIGNIHDNPELLKGE